MYEPGKTLEPGGVPAGAAIAQQCCRLLASFRWQNVEELLRDSLSDWSRHKAPRLGAALAFYTLLSITPLLVVVIFVAGLLVGHTAAEEGIVRELGQLVGSAGAQAVRALLDGPHNAAHGVLITLLGLFTLFFGATGLLLELRDALNTIWDVPAPDLQGSLGWILGFAKERLFSFALVLSVGLLLLVSLAINAGVSALGTLYPDILPARQAVFHILDAVLSFLVTAALFAAIYKVVPEVPIEWRDVILGGVVTSILFTAGGLLLGLYIGKAGFASVYGAAGSLVVFMVWVYYSSLIFFLGAELTKAFAVRHGSKASSRIG